jgi:hypothetical protein
MKRTRKPRVIYRALTTVSPRNTTTVIARGQEVDTSHLTPNELEMLIAQGAIERLTVTDEEPLTEAEAAVSAAQEEKP